MGEFRKSDSVYKAFWIESFIEIILGCKVIEEREKYQNSGLKIYIKSLPVLFAITSILSYNLYELLTKKNLTLFEILIIPLFLMAIAVILNIWINAKDLKTSFTNVIDLIQFMDEIFLICFQRQHKKLSVSANFLLWAIFLHLAIIGPTFTILIFMLPHSKYLLILEICTGGYLIFAMYLTIVRLMVLQRLEMLLSVQQIPNTKYCYWCAKNRLMPKNQLCQRHRIMLYYTTFPSFQRLFFLFVAS